ncbi:MAG: cysteine desulfurase family protein [Planctomycetota bacterium]
MIYLDNNSTTRMHPEVAEAMNECYQSQFVNPASQHAAGRAARKRLEQARDGIGRILGARLDTSHPDRILFTSGGTEANNLALRGIVTAAGHDVSRDFAISAVEHPSITELAGVLALEGHQPHVLPVDSRGVLKLDELGSLIERLGSELACVSVMAGNNETGVIQPVEKIVEMCGEHRIAVHTDAVQCVAKVPVSFERLGVDALSLTAHKFHGPRGIGALIVRHDLEVMPLLFGGGQQLATRPGTESVALAAGMWRALEIWQRDSEERQRAIQSLRDRMQEQLLKELPDVVINGDGAERLPHTLNVAFPEVDRQAMMLALDRAGLACSTGSACASGSSEPSPVLIAMGCDESIVGSSLRFSLSSETTTSEVDQAVAIIVEKTLQIKGFSDSENNTSASR